MNAMDIWVVTFEQSYVLEENNQLTEYNNKSSVAFDDKRDASAFVQMMLRNNSFDCIHIRPLAYVDEEKAQ